MIQACVTQKFSITNTKLIFHSNISAGTGQVTLLGTHKLINKQASKQYSNCLSET